MDPVRIGASAPAAPPRGRLRTVGPISAAAFAALLLTGLPAQAALAGCTAVGAPGPPPGPPSGNPRQITFSAFTCGDSGEQVTIDAAGGRLRHNRLADGDFASDADFDSASTGEQFIVITGGFVQLNAGGGDDEIVLGSASAPASTIQTQIQVLAGQGADDRLTIDDTANTTVARPIGVTAANVGGVGGPVIYDGLESLLIKAGGGGDTITVASTAASAATTIQAGGGNDTINVGNNGTLDGILGTLTIDGGLHDLNPTASLSVACNGNFPLSLPVGDVLNLNDQGDAGDKTYTLAATTLDRTGAAQVGYSAIETLTLNAGTGANTINVSSTPGSAITTVNGNTGVDAITVAATGEFSGVVLNGGAGADAITVQNTGNLTLLIANGDADGDTLTLQQSGADNVAVELNGGAAADTITVQNARTGSRVRASGGAGNDTLNVGSAAGSLDGIQGSICAVGNADTDALSLNDQGDGDDQTYTLTSTSVARGAATISYDTLETLTLNAGTARDEITVQSVANGVTPTVNGGGGDDTITWSADLVNATLDGGTGNDAMRFLGSDDPNQSDRVEVSAESGGIKLAQASSCLPFSPCPTPPRLQLGAFERFEFDGRAGSDRVRIRSLPENVAVSLSGGAGFDLIRVEATASGSPVSIAGGTDADTVSIASGDILERLAGNPRLIRSAVTVDAGAVGESNSLGLGGGFAGGGADDQVVTVTADRVGGTPGDSLFGPGGSLTFSGIDDLRISLENGADRVNLAPSATVTYTLDGGPSADTLGLDFGGATNPILQDRGQGDSEFTFDNRRPILFRQFETTLVNGEPISGTIQFGAAELRVDENGGQATVTVTRTSPISAAAVDFATSDGTARAGADYTARSGRLEFAQGEVSKSFTVPIANDSLVEGDETVTLTLSNVSGGAQISARNTAVLRIVDEDRATLSIAGVSVTEGNAGAASAVFAVSLSPSSALPVAVDFATADGSARAGADYTATSGRLEFAPGETSKTVAVAVLGDLLDESDETFTLTLTNASNAVIGTGQATGTIVDDDEPPPPPAQPPPAPPPPRVSIEDARVAEGNARAANLLFTVRLSAPAARPVTVDFATADQTARSVRVRGAPLDYLARRGRLTIPAGRPVATIAVPVLGDTQPEPDERFRVTLRNPVGATLGRATAAGTALDDESSRPPRLFVDDVAVAERGAGRSGLRFTVRLTRPAPGPVRFNFATADGTARAGSDYVAARGVLTIPRGQLSKTIDVTILGDRAIERDELFRLILSGVTGATVLDGVAIGTILNDDP